MCSEDDQVAAGGGNGGLLRLTDCWEWSLQMEQTLISSSTQVFLWPPSSDQIASGADVDHCQCGCRHPRLLKRIVEPCAKRRLRVLQLRQ